MSANNRSAPATKADLKKLELATKTGLKAVEQKLTGKIDAVEKKLTGQIDAVEQKLTGKINAVEQKLTGQIDAVEQKLTGQIATLDNRTGRLEAVTKNMALDMVRIQGDIDDIKERMATKADINRIMSAIDAYTAEAISYRNRDTLRGGKIMEHETRLSNHEGRITLLETAKQP